MSREFKLFGGWDETTATVWSIVPGSGRRHKVIITYSVQRKPYSCELRTDLPFVSGDVFPLRYDPANPRRNELIVRQHARQALFWGGILAVLAAAFALTYIPLHR